MKKLATVNAKALAAASLIMAKDDVRYYLNGVLIQPRKEGGVYLVATDGHRMIVITDYEGYTERDLIVRVAPATMTKLKQACSETAEILEQENETYIRLPLNMNRGSRKYIAYADIVDGRFPDWTAVIKDKEPGVSCQRAAFNGSLLDGFTQAARILMSKRSQPIALVNGGDPRTAINVVFGKTTDNLHVRGLLMPLHTGDTEMSWLP